jgi:hypothetical protein
MFLQRRFMPRRAPKFAGLIAVILAGLWAVLPNAVLFFANKLSWQTVERFQPGNITNVFIVKQPDHLLMHQVFAAGWLVLMLALHAKWFRQQLASFQPLEKTAPPATTPPPLPA